MQPCLCQGQDTAGPGFIGHIPGKGGCHWQSAIPDIFLGLRIYHVSSYSTGILDTTGEVSGNQAGFIAFPNRSQVH